MIEVFEELEKLFPKSFSNASPASPINCNLFITPDHNEGIFGRLCIEILTFTLDLEAERQIEVYRGAV